MTAPRMAKAGRQPKVSISQALPGMKTTIPNPVPTSAKPMALPRCVRSNQRDTTTADRAQHAVVQHEVAEGLQGAARHQRPTTQEGSAGKHEAGTIAV